MASNRDGVSRVSRVTGFNSLSYPVTAGGAGKITAIAAACAYLPYISIAELTRVRLERAVTTGGACIWTAIAAACAYTPF